MTTNNLVRSESRCGDAYSFDLMGFVKYLKIINKKRLNQLNRFFYFSNWTKYFANENQTKQVRLDHFDCF